MQAVERCQSRQLACKLQRKMARVTQNRNAHLLGISEQNREKEKRREEVRSRKRTLHFRPPADPSTSLLGDLPPITYVEANPTSEENSRLTIESCRRQLNWKTTLESMSERNVTEATERTCKFTILN